MSVIEQDGNASLLLIDGVYKISTNSDLLTLKRSDGSEYGESNFYSYTHVEPSGDGYVAVLEFADGRIDLRWFDGMGTLQTYTDADTVESYVEREAEIGIDLNGDGVLSGSGVNEGVVKQIDGASLQWTASGYTVTINGVTTSVLDGSGSQVVLSDTFEMVNLVRQDSGSDKTEYLAIGRDAVSGDYQVFIYDQFASQIELIGPLPESVLQAYEILDGIDFNADGLIGRGLDAREGVTSDLSGHWGNEGAIYGTAGADDIVIPDVLPEGTNSSNSGVDIFGGAGDDIIVGGNGENYFIGGAGDDTLMGQEDSDSNQDQEAYYDARGNGATQAPDIRTEQNGDVVIFDDTGDLYRLNLTGSDFNWVEDLSLADGLDEGRDTLVNVDVVFVLNGQGEFGITYNQETGEYFYKSPHELFVEVEDEDWGKEAEVAGTTASEIIDVETIPQLADFTESNWIDVEGGNGDDTLFGHAGGNYMEGGRGDDTLDGRGGYDTAAFSLFDLENYTPFLNFEDLGDGKLTITKDGTAVMTVELNADGTGTVTDLRPGTENLGTDTLIGIQVVKIEGTVDWLKISITDEGGYQVSGTTIAEISTAPENGYMDGTQSADTLIVSEENGFDPQVFDENSDIWLWGGGGDDTLVGHVGSNWFEGGAGDDFIDGVADSQWDSAYYGSATPSAFDQFWDAEGSTYVFDYRIEDNGSITVFVNNQDLYNLSLEGVGWVNDLWAADGDNGRDTVVNVNHVSIDGPFGAQMQVEFDAERGYDVWGSNVPSDIYAESDDFGFDAVFGTNDADFINVADFAADIDVSDTSTVWVEGRGGDDWLVGHAGANYLFGGAGNDMMDGAGGDDTAVYQTRYYDGPVTAPEVNVFVNGSTVTIGTTFYGDLYNIILNDVISLDGVGDNPQEASDALTAGNAVSSAFESNYDVDTFAVAVDAGQTYVIRGQGDDSTGQGADPIVRGITGEFDGYVGDWFNKVDNAGEYIEFTPNVTGTVYVSVESYFAMTGDYTLEVLPQGVAAPAKTVEVPRDYISAVTVQDVGYDDIWEGTDAVINTEFFEFSIDNGSGEANVSIDRTDTGYDIMVNGAKQDDVMFA
ncbi:hypothetical protein [Marinobacter sp. BSs20148]|uniref:hypothetical protein n=1 Tax=Marinobacter sp. BSs20148 TaxID=490759 RepID=UPI000277711A|nr:hypothetical protein [Marinobacter sp. BSs20148]AFP31426.1 hypothetical protein MRBBS_2490 [Marinobacter sp. BSs20148]